jgi:hypothetical protein
LSEEFDFIMSFFDENTSERLRISQILEKILEKIGKKKVYEVIQLASATKTSSATMFQKLIDLLLQKQLITQKELERSFSKKSFLDPKMEKRSEYELREASILMNFRNDLHDPTQKISFTARKKIAEYNSQIQISQQVTRQKIDPNEEFIEFSPYSDILSSNFERDISLSQIDKQILEMENEFRELETKNLQKQKETNKKMNDNFCFLSNEITRHDDGQKKNLYEGKKDDNYKCMNFFEFV